MESGIGMGRCGQARGGQGRGLGRAAGGGFGRALGNETLSMPGGGLGKGRGQGLGRGDGSAGRQRQYGQGACDGSRRLAGRGFGFEPSFARACMDRLQARIQVLQDRLTEMKAKAHNPRVEAAPE